MDPRVRKALDQKAKAINYLTQNLGPLPQVLNDPRLKQAYLDTQWIAAERNKALAAMPDADTKRALSEAARHLNSEKFQAQREAILQASEAMRRHLGAEGVAAAQHLVGRRLRATDNQEREVEAISSGEARQLLEDATRLASSPEVIDTLEQADAESLIRMDAAEAAQDEAVNVERDPALEISHIEDEQPELSKQELLEINRIAMQLFLILTAGCVSSGPA